MFPGIYRCFQVLFFEKTVFLNILPVFLIILATITKLNKMKSIYFILGNLLLICLISVGFNSCNRSDTSNNRRVTGNTTFLHQDSLHFEYVDSVMVARGKYIEDKPEGLWTYWYPNGQMKAEGNYANGLKNGMWVEWYDDGMLMWKGEWDMGIQKIRKPRRKAEISFIGSKEENPVLESDSVYHLQVRIPNMPAEYLYVEAENGSIKQEALPDQFLCIPGQGPSMKIMVGYYVDTVYSDFRNLVSVHEFSIR